MFKTKLATAYFLSRIAIAFIWLYHGLVPKLIFKHVTELQLIESGPVIHSAETTLMMAGIGEVILGVIVLCFWRHKWPALFSAIAFAGLLVAALSIAPSQAVHAFNPVTLSVSGILFGVINVVTHTTE